MRRIAVTGSLGGMVLAALLAGGTPAIAASEAALVRTEELSPAGELKFNPGLRRPESFWASRDGRRWAYVANRGSRTVMVVDGHEIGPYSSIGSVEFHVPGEENLKSYEKTPGGAFTPDGELFVFTASKGGQNHLVVVDKDGATEGPPLEQIRKVFMPPAGHRYAAIYLSASGASLLDRGDGNMHIVIDGKKGPSFAHLHEDSVTFSSDGRHIAFMAQRKLPPEGNSYIRNQVYNVFINGIPGPDYKNIAPGYGKADAPVRLIDTEQGPAALYIAKENINASGQIVLQKADGSVENGPVGIVPTPGSGPNVVVSADRRHWACYIQEEKQRRRYEFTVYLDGKEYASHEGAFIKELTLSPEGSRLAYALYSDGGLARPVVDGKPGLDYRQVEQFTFSPDGKRLAYVAAATNREAFVVLDGREHGPYDVSRLQFSPSGKHAAWLARDASNKFHLALDGELGPEVKMAQNAWIGFQPVEERLVYVTGHDNGDGRVQDKVVYFGLDGAERHPAATDPQLTPDGKHLAFIGRHWEKNKSRSRNSAEEPPFFVFDGRRVELAGPIQGGSEYLFDPDGRFVAAFVGGGYLANAVGQEGLSINGMPAMDLAWIGGSLHLRGADQVAAIGGSSDGQLFRVTADAGKIAAIARPGQDPPVLARGAVPYQKKEPWSAESLAYGGFGTEFQSAGQTTMVSGGPSGEPTGRVGSGGVASQEAPPKHAGYPPPQEPKKEPGAIEKVEEKVKQVERVKTLFKGLFGR